MLISEEYNQNGTFEIAYPLRSKFSIVYRWKIVDVFSFSRRKTVQSILDYFVVSSSVECSRVNKNTSYDSISADTRDTAAKECYMDALFLFKSLLVRVTV